ncbi:MAG: HNH endonuclease [Rhodovulum sp.]|nr:HNH endonuclease [Rhodovulum sp.]|tara:strand:+ start:4143 stop:5090 length:948 start_codon:yes stop_codon:yes gene_type:complete
MRRVERREAAPEDLEEKGAEELEQAIQHFENDPPNPDSFAFKRYKLKSVKDALERIFHAKCAYCETFYASSQPLDVEHFRPKGAVAGENGHRGYWWLAADWDNLLPSCIDCNRKRNQITPKGETSQVRLLDDTAGYSAAVTVGSGKKDSFPIAPTGTRARSRADLLAVEKPLLLNPCEDDPEQHLTYFFNREHPVSFVLAKKLAGDPDYSGEDGLSLKGATSVHIYGLNRLRLVQARTRLLRRLEFMADLAIDLKKLAETLKQNADPEIVRAGQQVDAFGNRTLAELALMCAEDQPYSAMAQAWMREFQTRLQTP